MTSPSAKQLRCDPGGGTMAHSGESCTPPVYGPAVVLLHGGVGARYCQEALSGTRLWHAVPEASVTQPLPPTVLAQPPSSVAAGTGQSNVCKEPEGRCNGRDHRMGIADGHFMHDRTDADSLTREKSQADMGTNLQHNAQDKRPAHALHMDQRNANEHRAGNDTEPTQLGHGHDKEGMDVANICSFRREIARLSTQLQEVLSLRMHFGVAHEYPMRRKLLRQIAKLNQRMQLGLAVDVAADKALELRVDAAILNNRWTRLAQPDMVGTAQEELESAERFLEAAESAAEAASAIAYKHGWLKAPGEANKGQQGA
jgi:hypothetical protein